MFLPLVTGESCLGAGVGVYSSGGLSFRLGKCVVVYSSDSVIAWASLAWSFSQKCLFLTNRQ